MQPYHLRLLGAVALEPSHSYTNEEIAAALDLPVLPRICRRIGIERRGTFLPLNLETGRVVGSNGVTELDFAEQVARTSIERAGIDKDDVAVFCLMSCTVQRGRRLHFEASSFELVRRLNLEATTFRFEMDTGCDGFVRALDMVHRLFRLPVGKSALLVATSFPSLYFDRHRCAQLPTEAQFPNYVFGDGAAAAVVTSGASSSGARILATWSGSDPSVELGWTLLAQDDSGASEVAYAIDYETVARTYVDAVELAVTSVSKSRPFDPGSIRRAYFHQANGMLPFRAADRLGIPPAKVAMNAKRAGNVAVASVPTLLATDLRDGLVVRGDLCLLAAVGAGLSCSAALVEI